MSAMNVYETTITLTARVRALSEEQARVKVDLVMEKLSGRPLARGVTAQYVDGGYEYDDITGAANSQPEPHK